MKFSKPPFTHEQQLDQLIQRGLHCADRAQALHYLGHLNYYRLGAYWLPFETDHASHAFKPGTRFDAVLNLYIFDREVRLLVLDAIERVEVSVRTCEKFGALRVLEPPFEEQRTIAYLDHETSRIDQLVAKVEAAIDRLTEYRQALITSAVTGKIDVRGLAIEPPSGGPRHAPAALS